MKPTYFPAFDSLRFLSILAVVFQHFNTFAANFGFTPLDIPILPRLSFLAVQFFFAGSGFLITYLLFWEFRSFGKLDLSSYFMRRLLRIWPGYYLLVAISFLLYYLFPVLSIPGLSESFYQSRPELGFTPNLLFLPHIIPFFLPTPPFTHHLYTIGIEEQFYLIWGLVIFYLGWRFKTWMPMLLLAILFLTLLHDLFYDCRFSEGVNSFLRLCWSAITYVRYSRISTFLIGSLCAIAVIREQRWLALFSHSTGRLVFQILFLASLLFVNFQFWGADELGALLMMGCLLFAHYDARQNTFLKQPKLRWLGKISFGIYLYHIIAISIAFNLIRGADLDVNGVALLAAAIAATALSVLFGWISYRYFERIFLNIQVRFRKYG